MSFFGAEIFEIVREIMKEIAHTRIVAITKHNLAIEMVFVVL